MAMDNNIIQELKKDGINKGLCRLWQMKLKSGLDIEALSKLFIQGIDFCISEDYPTIDYLRTHFKGRCEPYGIYIDDTIQGLTNIPDIALNGSCKADLNYTGYSVSRIYIRHQSEANINVSGHAILTIDVFDNANIKLHANGNSKILVYLYGKAKCINSGKGILIKKYNKKTY